MAAMDVENRSLRYAVTLAQYGNFARAAKALDLSQPALSRAIQSLEATIGARLFDRHAKGVRTTAIGDAFVTRARSILGEVDDLRRIAKDLSRGLIGRIDVGAGTFQSRLLVEPALRAFVAERVRLDVQLRVRGARELLAALRREEIDFYVASGETSNGQPDLEWIDLSAQRLVLYVRPGHPLLREAPVSWARVFQYPIASSTGAEVRMSWLRGERSKIDDAAGIVVADDLGLLRNLVEAGESIGSEPLVMIAPELERGRFVELRLDGILPAIAPAVVWHRDRPLSPAALALVGTIVEIDRKLGDPGASALRANGG
jgi:DNA-binding transcriptional LysR family regulator